MAKEVKEEVTKECVSAPQGSTVRKEYREVGTVGFNLFVAEHEPLKPKPSEGKA